VIVKVDVISDGGVQGVVAVECQPMIEVGLHRLVPGFHVRVVVHALGSIRRLHETGALELPFEIGGHELDATVAVEEGAVAGLAGPQRRGERATRHAVERSLPSDQPSSRRE